MKRWWDDELWRVMGPGEFAHAVSPEKLLSVQPDPIWPPLMPANFLPLVGNGAGDWLCLRLLDPQCTDPQHTDTRETGPQTNNTNDVTPADICHWYHGGGDWLPWGNSLPEALLFDWLLPLLPQPDRRHATPAETSPQSDPGGGLLQRLKELADLSSTTTNGPLHSWCDWANEELSLTSRLSLTGATPLVNDDQPADGMTLAHDLLRAGLCDIPVRCQLVLDAITGQLTDTLTPTIANELGIAWNDWMRWSFDLKQLPRDIGEQLLLRQSLPASALSPEQQDWRTAKEHASWVSDHAPDLAWGHEILGYTHYREGRHDEAMGHFLKASRCSVFTDQSVRLRTHWATSIDGITKFSHYFLRNRTAEDQQQWLQTNPQHDRLGMVPVSHSLCFTASRSEHCESLLAAADSNSLDPVTKLLYLHAAGWDLGAEPLSLYGDLMDRYVINCEQAAQQNSNYHGLLRLARIHRECLRVRYKI